MTNDAIPTLEFTRTCPFAPPAQHQQFRQETPITKVKLPSGATAWVVTRHEDIKAVLSDPRFSANRRHPGAPRLSMEPLQALSAKPFLIDMDGQEHTNARRAILGEFTVKRMGALAPRIQQIVDEHIDTMLAGPRPVDLVQALSLPVPSLVICELLGVPYADHEFFQTRSAMLVSRKASKEERGGAFFELIGYLNKLVTTKEQEPTDDLLGRQITKLRDEGTYDHESMVGLAFILLLAGHETTANMISLSTYMLLKHPDQLAIFRQGPSHIPSAIEELLRYFTIAEGAIMRVAIEDVEIGGVVIKSGEGVLALANTGNRDPDVYDHADELDVQRGARNHLAFGFGPHQCLGQSLARLELHIVLDTLFKRIPELRIAVPEEQLSFKHDATIYGMHEFPVTW